MQLSQVKNQEELQLLQNENEKLKIRIETLKACHVKEMCRLINIINDKSQPIKLMENELAASEMKLNIMSRNMRDRDNPLSLRNSNTSLLHPSEIIYKN